MRHGRRCPRHRLIGPRLAGRASPSPLALPGTVRGLRHRDFILPVAECHEYVHLAAPEATVVVAVLRAQRGPEAAGMNRVVSARRSRCGDVLVDRDALDVAVLLAGITPHVVDPARMIDEDVERRVTAVDIVQFEAGVLGVVAALGVADPVAVGEVGKAVVGIVEPSHFIGRQRRAQHDEAAEVEEVVVEGGRRDHGDPFSIGRGTESDRVSVVRSSRQPVLGHGPADDVVGDRAVEVLDDLDGAEVAHPVVGVETACRRRALPEVGHTW